MPLSSLLTSALRRVTATAAVAVAVAVAVAGAATLVVLATSASAVASATIPDGYYSVILNKRFPSAEVDFQVNDHGTRIPHLTLYCHSDKTLYNGGAAADISITTGALTIRSGSVTATDTQADVRPGGIHTVAAYAPLHLAIHHVDGPVVHYTVHGRQVHLATAWIGTIASPACTTIAAAGRVLVFGPVP